MVTPDEADALCEKLIAQYSKDCACETPEDVRKVLEKLISKSVLGIQKYCGTENALQVLDRTVITLLR